MALCLLIAVRAHGGHGLLLAPWLPNMISEYGVLGWGVLENLGVKPLVIPAFVRALLTLLIFLGAAATFAALVRGFKKIGAEASLVPSWTVTLTLIAPFSVAYLLLLLPRAAFVVTLDRYLIPLAALLMIPLLRFYQERVQFRVPAISFAALAVFSGYGVASTHDYFATDRARLAAAEEIRLNGIPRTEIQGGWEYDSWTQLETSGYINDWRIENPSGAFHKPPPPSLPEPCRYWFSDHTPAVSPRYFVVFSPMSCLAPSNFAPVRYRAWLPPFHRQIEIEQLPSQFEAQTAR